MVLSQLDGGELSSVLTSVKELSPDASRDIEHLHRCEELFVEATEHEYVFFLHFHKVFKVT